MFLKSSNNALSKARQEFTCACVYKNIKVVHFLESENAAVSVKLYWKTSSQIQAGISSGE